MEPQNSIYLRENIFNIPITERLLSCCKVLKVGASAEISHLYTPPLLILKFFNLNTTRLEVKGRYSVSYKKHQTKKKHLVQLSPNNIFIVAYARFLLYP